jgi:hypothetical protein
MPSKKKGEKRKKRKKRENLFPGDRIEKSIFCAEVQHLRKKKRKRKRK